MLLNQTEPEAINVVRSLSVSRTSILQLVGVAALLSGTRVAHDFAVATAFTYPEYDFGQRGFAFFAVLVALVFTFVLAGVRAFQLRLIETLALLALLFLPFSFSETFDKDYWRFRIHKPEYQSIVQIDPSPSPKYRVFDWGNRSPPFGAGVTFEAIVFDESDEISQTPNIAQQSGSSENRVRRPEYDGLRLPRLIQCVNGKRSHLESTSTTSLESVEAVTVDPHRNPDRGDRDGLGQKAHVRRYRAAVGPPSYPALSARAFRLPSPSGCEIIAPAGQNGELPTCRR